MLLLKNIKNFLNKNEKKIPWLMITIFILVIFSLLFNKYQAYGYNALDLGIYNQVFYNSAHGDLFAMSIHPHSYLGDHFELFIILLLPFYMIFKSPLNLLFLQTLFVGLSAWPLYLIAKNHLKSFWPLIVILVFFLNPLVLNLLFFEFHILPFAIFTLLFAFYFYDRGKFIPFMIFVLLSLLVREDVSLVVIMFGVLAFVDRKNKKWILAPLIAGGLWFIMALKLTGYFNHYGDYKFLSMYGWLGGSLTEIIYNVLAHPWQIFKQIFSLNNFLSFFTIFLPLFALPILKPKYFIPVILVATQLLLLSPTTSILIETHYTSLIIPFIFIALIFTLTKITSITDNNPIFSIIKHNKSIIFILFFVTIAYSFFTLSPIWPSIFNRSDNTKNDNFINEKIINANEDENILTSFNFLPNLSSRKQIYSLHYAFLGKKQFSKQDFNIEVPIDKSFIDFDDFTIFYVQTKYNQEKEDLYPNGADNIKLIMKKNNLVLTDIFDTYAYYESNGQENYKLIEFGQAPDSLNNKIHINYEISLNSVEKNIKQVPGTLGISMYWEINNKLDDDYFISLTAKDDNEKIYQKVYPLGYLLYPTSTWPADQDIKTNYWFYLPDDIMTSYDNLDFQILKIKDGRLKLNGQRTAEIVISEAEKIGDSFTVNYKTL